MRSSRRRKASRRRPSNDDPSSKGSLSASRLATQSENRSTSSRRMARRAKTNRTKPRTRARRSQNNRRFRERIFIFFAISVLFLPVFFSAQMIARSAAHDASEYLIEQTTPTLGLVQGHQIVGGPEDLRVTSAAMNPIPSMFFLSIGWMGNPEELLARSALVASAISLVPLFIVFFYQTRRSTDTALKQFGMFCGVTLALIPAFAFRDLSVALFLPGPYPLVIACLLVASLLLVYGGTKSLYYFSNLAGILIALASWIEPAAAGAFFAAVFFFQRTSRFADLRRFIMVYVGFGVVFGCFAGLVFGFDELRFNLVDIALRAPVSSWTDGDFFMSWSDGYLAALKHTMIHWGWLLLPAGIILREANREIGRSRQRPGKERFGPLTAGILCLFAITVLPFVPLTMLRIGGNPYAPALFAFPIFAAIGLVLLSQWLHNPPTRRGKRFAVSAVFLLGLLTPLVRESARLIGTDRPWSPRLAATFLALKKEPGWYYAPFDPLAHLMAEKRLYPNGAAMDRHRYVSPEPVTISIRELVPMERRKLLLPEQIEGHPSLGFIRFSFPYHDQPGQTEPEDANIPVVRYLEIPPADYELLLRRQGSP